MFSIATKFSPEAANFEKAVFAGYESAELYLTPLRLMSWRSLSKIARSYDLDYLLHFPTGDKTSQQTCEEIVELCRDISCDLVTVHEDDLNVADYITSIDPTIRLAVENQVVEFDDLDDWFQSHDAITLNIDFLWQKTLRNCDLKELLSVTTRLIHDHRDRIQIVHLSGLAADQFSRGPIHTSPEISGALLDVLFLEQFEGTVVCEIDTTSQTSQSLRQDLEWFHSWQRQKGVTNLVDSQSLVGTQNQVHESL